MMVNARLRCAGLMWLKLIPEISFQWTMARALLPVSFLYNLNVLFALTSMGHLNLPM